MGEPRNHEPAVATMAIDRPQRRPGRRARRIAGRSGFAKMAQPRSRVCRLASTGPRSRGTRDGKAEGSFAVSKAGADRHQTFTGIFLAVPHPRKSPRRAHHRDTPPTLPPRMSGHREPSAPRDPVLQACAVRTVPTICERLWSATLASGTHLFNERRSGGPMDPIRRWRRQPNRS